MKNLRLVGRVGLVEHICEDMTCSCQQDPFIAKVRGKWVAELFIVNGRGQPIQEPMIVRPFESEIEAGIGLEDLEKEAVEVLSQNGYDLKTKFRAAKNDLH